MAESQQDQPRTPGESSAQPRTIREQLLANLQAERGGESVEETPDQLQDADDYEEGETVDESQFTADQPDDGSEGEESDDDQPDPDEAPGVFTVDGVNYSADDVRDLVDSRSKWDNEFRRRTQITARLRREYETNTQEVSNFTSFFTDLANANVEQYNRFDTSSLTPEQYQIFHQRKNEAERGREQLLAQMNQMQQSINEKTELMATQRAEESREVLKGIEPRWNDEFYTRVREFAIESGRYDADEFAQIDDWRTIEGLISLMDRTQLTKPSEAANREPKKPSRRRQRNRPRRRNARGQFQSAQQRVLESPNAKADGSMRDMFRARLAAERGE